MKKYKNDIILIFALLVISGCVILYMSMTHKEGAAAIVTVDGVELYRLQLDEDTMVTAGDGEHYNIIEVKDGSVSVSEASCPDKICVNQGKINRSGEMIVCLPNKLMITVESAERQQIDAAA